MLPVVQKAGKITAVAQGGSDSCSLDKLQDDVLGLHGNITGLYLDCQVDVDESAASAALAWETLMGLLASITLEMPGGAWCNGVSGKGLLNFLGKSGLLYGAESSIQAAVDLIHLADLASSESATAVRQIYFIPLAPYYYLAQNFFEDEDLLVGAAPLAWVKKMAKLAITTITSLGGNWRFDSASDTLDCDVWADVVYTENPVTYVPSFLREKQTSEDSHTLEGIGDFNAFDHISVHDDAYSTFTDGTEPRITVEGKPIQNFVDGLTIQKLKATKRRQKMEDFTQDGNCLVACTDMRSPASFIRGRDVTVWKAGAQATAPYLLLYHGFGSPTDDTIVGQLEAAKVKAAVIDRIRSDWASAQPRKRSRVHRGGLPIGISSKEDYAPLRERAGRAASLIVNR